MTRAVLHSLPPHSRENAVPCTVCGRRTWSLAALCIGHEHLAKSPAPRRSTSSPSLPGLSGGGDAATRQVASPEYDPEGEA